MSTRLLVSISAVLLMVACGSSSKPDAHDGASGSAGSADKGGGGPVVVGGEPMHEGPKFAGAECPDVGLPGAYALNGVTASIEGSTARIRFDPLADAKDYRVYVLPSAADVSGNTIKNATYRCAGRTAVPQAAQEGMDVPGGTFVRTFVTTMVNGFARTLDDATLGYVFTTPADDRVPVYTLGDPSVKADNICNQARWPESRVKRYVTSEAERKDLIAKSWRDDGIAFYAPKPDAAGTQVIYSADEKILGDFSAKYYLKTGAELDKRTNDGYLVAPSFSVYTEKAKGAEPLMRVFYGLVCGRGHDELVPGVARFNRAYAQGDQPVTELHFSGLTTETTLVVEALDELCPFPGAIAAMSRPARNNDKIGDKQLEYPQFMTPDEIRATSASGELFVGGEGDSTSPKAISRACVKVKPETPPDAEFRYSGGVETWSDAKNTGFQIWELESPTFNVQFHSVATDEYAVGSLFNELWVTYADWAADTNGKMRLTPKARATLTDDKFVHATMTVDAISSQRRYPQLLISDVEWPVQNNLEQGGTIITQYFGGITSALQVQLQFCDHRTWDVNNQCPQFDLDTMNEGDAQTYKPHPEADAFFGIDRTVLFDVYASTARAYVFINNIPYGCADLPAGKIKAGSATVTFGDVLYHSDADLKEWYPFHLDKMHYYTSRHFSNLAFTSKVAAPAWNEALVPCVPAGELK